jgi:hypothetical protein
MIFLKIFFGVWLARKNYKMQKSEFGKCRRNLAMSGRRCWILARKFDRIWPQWPDQVIFGRNLPDPAIFGWIHPNSTESRPFWPELAGFQPFWPDPAGLAGIWWPASSAGRIPATGRCRTPAPVRFRRSTIAKL